MIVSCVMEIKRERDKYAEDFAHQIEQQSRRLQGFAYYLTRDKEESKDLVQETLYRAYIYRHSFRVQTNLSAWLCTIMRNVFFNLHRKQQQRPYIQAFEPGTVEQSASSTDNLAYNVFLSDDLRAALSATRSELRRPFLMYFYGFKYREIAEQLGVPIGTVKHRIHLAKKALRTIVHQLHHLRVDA